MGKGTKLYSIFFNKCPRCQKGNFFAVNNPYNLKQFDQMTPQCLCCGERFEKEPGYYTGALYVSYGYYTALIVFSFIVFQVLVELDLTYFLIVSQPTSFADTGSLPVGPLELDQFFHFV